MKALVQHHCCKLIDEMIVFVYVCVSIYIFFHVCFHVFHVWLVDELIVLSYDLIVFNHHQINTYRVLQLYSNNY